MERDSRGICRDNKGHSRALQPRHSKELKSAIQYRKAFPKRCLLQI